MEPPQEPDTTHSEQPPLPDRIGTTRAVRYKVVVIALFLVVAVGAVTFYYLTRSTGPTPSVDLEGWSGESILCSASTNATNDDIWDAHPGDVLPIEGDVDSYLETNMCGIVIPSSPRETRPIQTDDDTQYFLVVSRSDRHDLRLIDVNTNTAQTTLTVEHDVAGPDCMETAEWRGHLLLLVTAPLDAEVPTATLTQHYLPC